MPDDLDGSQASKSLLDRSRQDITASQKPEANEVEGMMYLVLVSSCCFLSLSSWSLKVLSCSVGSTSIPELETHKFCLSSGPKDLISTKSRRPDSSFIA